MNVQVEIDTDHGTTKLNIWADAVMLSMNTIGIGRFEVALSELLDAIDEVQQGVAAIERAMEEAE